MNEAASRLELVLKRLVNSALEGDVGSAGLLFKSRAAAENSNSARIEKFIAEDWIPDFSGQTGEQKTRAHARDNEIKPTGFWEPGSKATDPPGSVSASPKPPRDEWSTDQQPWQIDLIIFSTFASSRSTTGLLPPSGPF
jgi:hypothetical protein